jgi:trypsin-like peptidase
MPVDDVEFALDRAGRALLPFDRSRRAAPDRAPQDRALNFVLEARPRSLERRPRRTSHNADRRRPRPLGPCRESYGGQRRRTVALGVLEHPSGYVLNSVPTLTTECPQIGEPIVAVAYDKGTHQNDNNTLTIWPKCMSGEFEYAHPDGRDTVMLPFPCYRSSINIPGGASGGPVFDVRGRVFGINCTGYEGTAVSYLARVGEILALVAYEMTLEFNGAPTDRTLLQLAQSGHVVFSPKIL